MVICSSPYVEAVRMWVGKCHQFGQMQYLCSNFEKVGSILVSACPSVRACVRSSKKFKARVLKFHIWIPHKK